MNVRPVFAFPLSLSSFTISSLLFGESRFISTEKTVENVVIQHSKLITKEIKRVARRSNRSYQSSSLACFAVIDESRR